MRAERERVSVEAFDQKGVTMGTGDWILGGVGVAQAFALLAAAWFARQTYKAAKEEREAGRLQPVVTEMTRLAEVVETYKSAGSGIETVFGQQARLRVALDLLPTGLLPQTRLLARLGRDDLVDGGQLEAARLELARAVDQLSPASFGVLSGNE